VDAVPLYTLAVEVGIQFARCDAGAELVGWGSDTLCAQPVSSFQATRSRPGSPLPVRSPIPATPRRLARWGHLPMLILALLRFAWGEVHLLPGAKPRILVAAFWTQVAGVQADSFCGHHGGRACLPT
jgi:hypothetical protein